MMHIVSLRTPAFSAPLWLKDSFKCDYPEQLAELLKIDPKYAQKTH